MQPDGTVPPACTKRCSVCGRELPAEAFVKNSRYSDGLAELCRPCKMARQRERMALGDAWRSTPAEKRCTGCGEVFPADNFHRNRWSKDGLKPTCKACNSARARAYDAGHRQQVVERKRVAYRANMEAAKERDRLRRQRDHAKIVARKQAYQVKNGERLRAKSRSWRRANIERARALGREQLRRFPEKQWARNATRRARVRNAPVVEKVDRNAIIARDKSICGICGKYVEAKEIHLDHIVPLSQGGTHTAANLRVTHRLCNLSRKRTGYAEQLRWFF